MKKLIFLKFVEMNFNQNWEKTTQIFPFKEITTSYGIIIH